MPLLFLSLAFFVLGGGLALAQSWQDRVSHVVGTTTALAGASAGLLACADLILAGGVQEFSVPWATAGITIVLRVDDLALFFLLPVFLLTLCGALYAAAYLHPAERRGQYGYHWFFFNLLAASMVLVVIAANGLFFLVAWETMALSSFFLVTYDYTREEVREAGWLYLIATHSGTVFLFLFFLMAARQCGSFDFAAFASLKAAPPSTAVLFFLLALVGFGTKAGLFPLHVWLPDAHPAAPSHVSALMSGVMIKTGIYGILRLLTLLPPLPAWCAVLLLTLGIGGALFGIGLAILQTDIKRSLAYSTVENIGLIFFGIGLWMYGAATGQPTAAVLVLTGAMLHIWNHALFKGALFLGAGSILHATGTRTLSHLGGLLQRMPCTGTLLILACVAIAALPPLNGFISEWLLYMGIFRMGQAATSGGAVFFLLLAALFALLGGLVLLAVTRLAGLALLGGPRRPAAAHAHEPAWPMPAAMTILVTLCLLIGLFPTVPLRLITGPITLLTGQSDTIPAAATLPWAAGWSFGAGLVLVLAAIGILGRYFTGRAAKAVSTWGCGFAKPTPRMSYMASGFSQLAQDNLLCACMLPRVSETEGMGTFPAEAAYHQHSLDPVLISVFAPLFSRLAEHAYMFRRLQAGQLDVYLFYIFVSTTLLLSWVMYQF